jgi:hypothetical protein
LRSANGESGIVCQYNSRCPVGHHKRRENCRYANRRHRSPSIPGEYSTPSLPRLGSPRNVTSKPPERGTAPKRSPQYQEERRVHRYQNRQILIESTTDTATEVAVTYLFQPGGAYEIVADRLLDTTRPERKFKRPSGHWLCVVLNDAARSCETGTYVDLAAKGIEQGLRKAYRMPRVVARVLADCAGTSAKLLLASTVFGSANLPIVLRGLIALVCPNLDRCPTQADVRTALLGPLAADSLRRAVAGN